MAEGSFPQLVVVGSSAGGIEALSRLVGQLPEDFPAPVVLAQHLHPDHKSNLEHILARHSKLPVRTVDDLLPLEGGIVFAVPANRHVTITNSDISVQEDVHGRPKPSVDALMKTAAEVYGERLIAVVLAGTGSDGTEGARAVKRAGGTVVIQDPETAEFGGMPRSLAPNTVDVSAPLDEIGNVLKDLLSGEFEKGEGPAEENRSYLATLVRSTNDAIVGLDEEFDIVSWNRGAQKVFGYQSEEMIGRSLLYLIPPEHHESAQRNRERLERGEEFHDRVARLFTKSGEAVYVSMSISPVIDGADNSGFVWVVQDITTRRRAEKALRKSEERYRTLFDSVPVAVYACDADGEIREFNRRASELWGREPGLNDARDRFCGSFRIFYPDGRFMPHDEYPVAKVLRGEKLKPEEPEILVERPDGERRNVIAHPRPLKNERGEIAGAINCLYDITESKRAQEALRAGEQWLRLSQEAAGSGTWEWDLRAKSIRWSEEHYALFGLDPKEPVTFEKWWKEVPPEDVRRIEEAWERCAAGREEEVEVEYRVVQGGEVRWLDARGRTAFDEAGRAERVVGITLDVTERHRAAEQQERLLRQEWTVRAEAAERQKLSRDLHDYVAHEIGVAYQSLQLFEALAESDPERARQKLRLAKEMVKSSLDSTRQLSAELRLLDAEEDLENALEDLAEALARPKMNAEVSLEGNVCVLPGRVRGQIYLILREALANAVRHSEGGKVSVEVSVRGGQVVGRVSDDGRGFDPASTGPPEGRRGVGLNSMRERAELLGGELFVRSAPQEGTTVEVRVPSSERSRR